MTERKIVIRFCKNIGKFCNEINKHGGGIFFCGGWNFSKLVSMTSYLIETFFMKSTRLESSLYIIVQAFAFEQQLPQPGVP